MYHHNHPPSSKISKLKKYEITLKNLMALYFQMDLIVSNLKFPNYNDLMKLSFVLKMKINKMMKLTGPQNSIKSDHPSK